jgi:hypothetical protein
MSISPMLSAQWWPRAGSWSSGLPAASIASTSLKVENGSPGPGDAQDVGQRGWSDLYTGLVEGPGHGRAVFGGLWPFWKKDIIRKWQ